MARLESHPPTKVLPSNSLPSGCSARENLPIRFLKVECVEHDGPFIVLD
jgi:hypothetical protein